MAVTCPFYEGYVQIENGVGMLRSLITEFDSALRMEDAPSDAPPFTIATGASAKPFLQTLCGLACEKTGVKGQVSSRISGSRTAPGTAPRKRLPG